MHQQTVQIANSATSSGSTSFALLLGLPSTEACQLFAILKAQHTYVKKDQMEIAPLLDNFFTGLIFTTEQSLKIVSEVVGTLHLKN
jgi:hypothetical protein